jgi:GST-like protein
MITLYTVPTPNGHKVTIMLEEIGLPYTVVPCSIRAGDQFKPDFLKISPNNKFPAMIDDDPIGGGAPLSLFESGAILIYLADKSGRLLPREPRKHYDVLKWLMWQMAGLGPLHGQAHHFVRYAPEHHDYATARYMKEAVRLMSVLEGQLDGRDWIAADEYSIADIACWPWVRSIRIINLAMSDFPNVARWFERVGQRPAVQIGRKVIDEDVYNSPSAERRILPPEWWSNMFGENQHRWQQRRQKSRHGDGGA